MALERRGRDAIVTTTICTTSAISSRSMRRERWLQLGRRRNEWMHPAKRRRTLWFAGLTDDAHTMNSSTVRHRAAAKQHALARTHSWDSYPKDGSSITQQNKKIHAGLLYRVISIVSLFTITVLLISRAHKSHRTTRISGGRENLSFVTVVMPR